MKKIVSLMVFLVFTTTAFAQISLEATTARKKNHRGYKRPTKIKHPKR
jgi:hypothetical protein